MLCSRKCLSVICGLYLLTICQLTTSVLSDETNTENTSAEDTKHDVPQPPSKNNTVTASPPSQTHPGMKDLIYANQDMLRRAMYVTFAVSGILIVYFGIRFIRARRRRARRYGRLVTPGRENMEMEHLASDEDEDVTVFDARQSLMQ
ncbi:uncharacterized protein LOC120348407 [Styela clava]